MVPNSMFGLGCGVGSTKKKKRKKRKWANGIYMHGERTWK